MEHLDSLTNHLTDLLKSFWSKNLGSILFVTGIALAILVVYLEKKSILSIESIITLLKLIIPSCLAGGIYTWLMKTAQFQKIFKKEIEDVMYSDGGLAKRGDLPALWNKVTHLLHANSFSGIQNKIYDSIRDNYLSSTTDYYYSNLQRNIFIDVHDKEKGILKVDVVATSRIIPNRNKKIIERSLKFNYSPLNDLPKPEVNFILSTINERNQEISLLGDSETKHLNDGNIEIRHTFKDIPTTYECNATEKFSFFQRLEDDNQIIWRSSSYTDGVCINITNNCNDFIKVKCDHIGNIDLSKQQQTDKLTIAKSDKLLFSGQGVIINLLLLG